MGDLSTQAGDLRSYGELVHIVREPFATIGFRAICTYDNHYVYEGTSRVRVSDGPPTCLWCVAGVKEPFP